MSIKNLIEFIDRHTNNGAIYSNEAWREDVRNEGIMLIHSFSGRDWLALHDLSLKKKNKFWIKCLIHLLNEARTEEARQMIIYIALNGTEDNFYDAIECIQDFRRNVSIYTWLKLKNRSAEILKSRESR